MTLDKKSENISKLQDSHLIYNCKHDNSMIRKD